MIRGRQRGVRHVGQIGDARTRVELIEDVVAAGFAALPRDLAVGVLEVAELDRAGRAGLLAGRLELPVPHQASLGLRLVLRTVHPLHAEGALLHHALPPNRDVGVQLQVQGVGELVLEPVESADLVGAVVRAVPRAHASVVDLGVQPFGRVVRRVYGTDGLAGSIAAVLAHHRLLHGLEAAVLRVHEVPIDLDPRHLAALCADLLADRRHVVLRVAGGHAGRATGAGVQVDGHPPPVGTVRIGVVGGPNQFAQVHLVAALGVQRLLDVDQLRDLAAEVRVAPLQDDQPAPLTGRAQRDGGAGKRLRSAHAICGARQQIQRIHAPAPRVASVGRVSLSERYRDGVGPNAPVDERGRGHGPGLRAHLHEIAVGDA